MESASADHEMPTGLVYEVVRALDFVFGRGVDDDPLWLLVVRLNVLVLLAGLGWWVALRVRRGRADRWSRSSTGRRGAAPRLDAFWPVAVITALAGLLRFALALPNLMDFGGIPYSRLLYGYKGHFGAAQLYSVLYQLSSRDIGSAILFDQVVGVLTIPLLYVVCRALRDDRQFALLAAFLLAVSPVHVLFSASDALPISSLFLLVLGLGLLLTESVSARVAGFAAIALMTQVRYENVLFAGGAIAIVWWQSPARYERSFLASVAGCAALIGYYLWESASSGMTFQNPVSLTAGLAAVVDDIVLSPFVAAWAMFVCQLPIFVYRGGLAGGLALLPWIPALLLPVLADSSHGVVRVFCSWLIPILPLSAYGIALCRTRWLTLLVGALFAGQLIWQSNTIHRQHLEILETIALHFMVEQIPEKVTRLIVPDDELLRRHSQSTIELMVKYRWQVGDRVAVEGITSFLENTDAGSCGAGRCAFFFGLPCFDQDVYPFTRSQCLELLDRYAVTPLSEQQVEAEPFHHCSMSACAASPQRFVLYSLATRE